MVRIVGEEQSDEERLERLVRDHAERAGLQLEVTGWTRKTFDVFFDDRPKNKLVIVARVETFAIQSGEVSLYDERGLAFAEGVAGDLEQTFTSIGEATIIKAPPPV